MVTHDWHYRIGKLNAAENLRADGGVDLHFLKLGLSQAARFVNDVCGYRQLPDIVKQRSGFQRGDFSL